MQNVGIGLVQGLIPYDESADAAALYNPIVGTQAANPVLGARIYPAPGQQRVQPVVHNDLKTKPEPVDIDDDIED